MKRGFFFTVMALAMLSFMLITVQVWVRTYEETDRYSAERFKGVAIRNILFMISEKELNEFANASAFYATHKLVNYTSAHELISDDIEGNETVNRTIYELMKNGTTSSDFNEICDLGEINYTGEEINRSTLQAWQDNIKETAALAGFNVTFSEMKNFSFYQIDHWNVRLKFDMDMNISDFGNTMKQSKSFKVNTSFSIIGFQDPSITRNEWKRRDCYTDPATIAQKQIWKKSYDTPDDVKPDETDGIEGNGWFYGPLIDNKYPFDLTGDEQTVLLPRLNQTILLKKTYDTNLTVYADMYGAVLLTFNPNITIYVNYNGLGCNVTAQGKCLNCLVISTAPSTSCGGLSQGDIFPGTDVSVPVIVAPNFNESDIYDDVHFPLNDSTAPKYPHVLIDNEYENPLQKENGYHRIWDMGKLRDMAVCGFYLEGPGPSFFQRMLNGTEHRNSSNYGIETFLAGKWAGGEDYDGNDYCPSAEEGGGSGGQCLSDEYSRLDWEFYRQALPPYESIDALRIKGMFGCKSKEMCDEDNINTTQVGIGRFRLGNETWNGISETIVRYGLENITCGIGSSCDMS